MAALAREALGSVNPAPVAGCCAKLALMLYDIYSTRGDKLRTFARCCSLSTLVPRADLYSALSLEELYAQVQIPNTHAFGY